VPGVLAASGGRVARAADAGFVRPVAAATAAAATAAAATAAAAPTPPS